MKKRLALHSSAENILEAPALAWSSLAWYWGLSFLGLGPLYMEYMQSGQAEIDKAFFDNMDNDDINHIPGYDKNLTVKQRFERAVTFYEYCFIQGRITSSNPPWDFPPDVDTLVAFRNRMEARAQQPDYVIKTTTDHVLADNPKYLSLWEQGSLEIRENRALDYAAQVKEATNYVLGEVVTRMQLVIDQLDKNTGFLVQGYAPDNIPATVVDDMDQAMSDEKQWDKLGDVYIQRTPSSSTVVSHGILGRYYKAGHSLETAMWNDDRKRELSGIHLQIVRTWHQLMEIKRTSVPTTEE